MKVYGADFSGARDASRGIYYAEGFLEKGAMTIKRVTHCDDRLDLLAACVTIGYAIYSYGLEDDWGKKHAWVSDVEWEHRFNEGLIVKLH